VLAVARSVARTVMPMQRSRCEIGGDWLSFYWLEWAAAMPDAD